jgi:zinc protease
LLAPLLVAALAAPAVAAPPKKLPVIQSKLSNGLTLIVQEDHTVPIVAVDLWYHVGSKEEKLGRTGFAHLFEHMMFKGSAHVGDGEHMRSINEAGGTNNASTNTDRTNFHEVVPSNFLERALWLESDRMGYLLDALTKEKLDNQRDVVRNERRQNYENRPYGMAIKSVMEKVFPEKHPYHWLTIGDHADLEAASVDDVKEFFRTWYVPGNASLAVVGDVSPAEAKRLAEKYFGALPTHPTPARTKVPAVVLAADQKVRLEDRVSLERVNLAWVSPAVFAPGDADLDLLATVLTSKSGRLYERLVYKDRVAQSVSASQESRKLGSVFEIVATARPGHDAAELTKIIDEELQALTTTRPVTAAELARSLGQWEASFVYSMEGIFGRAERYNHYFADTGKADGVDQDLARYRKATPSSVNQWAKKIFGGHRVEVVVVPAPKTAKEGK